MLYMIRVIGTAWLKIGISNDPEQRLKTLQTGNPMEMKIIHAIGPLNDAMRWEQRIHDILIDDGKHLRGEWFLVMPGEEIDILESVGFRFVRKGNDE